jgi:hypothetical protein
MGPDPYDLPNGKTRLMAQVPLTVLRLSNDLSLPFEQELDFLPDHSFFHVFYTRNFSHEKIHCRIGYPSFHQAQCSGFARLVKSFENPGNFEGRPRSDLFPIFSVPSVPCLRMFVGAMIFISEDCISPFDLLQGHRIPYSYRFLVAYGNQDRQSVMEHSHNVNRLFASGNDFLLYRFDDPGTVSRIDDSVANPQFLSQLPPPTGSASGFQKRLSAPSHKYGDVSRRPRRPTGKARGGRIPGVFNRRATRSVGMGRPPNAIVFMRWSTKPLHPGASCVPL